MSETGKDGVVDKYLKVHGYPNMHITDGSVVQGNIGVNPSLTITAMAEYAMSQIPMRDGAQINEQTLKLQQIEKEWKEKKST